MFWFSIHGFCSHEHAAIFIPSSSVYPSYCISTDKCVLVKLKNSSIKLLIEKISLSHLFFRLNMPQHGTIPHLQFNYILTQLSLQNLPSKIVYNDKIGNGGEKTYLPYQLFEWKEVVVNRIAESLLATGRGLGGERLFQEKEESPGHVISIML